MVQLISRKVSKTLLKRKKRFEKYETNTAERKGDVAEDTKF
jgi:hypothetical protein